MTLFYIALAASFAAEIMRFVEWIAQLNKPKRRPRWAVSVTGSRRSPDDGREKRS